MLGECVDWIQQGKLQLTTRTAAVDATDIENVLQDLLAKEVKRISVVRMPQDTSVLPGRSKARSLSLDPDAAYLITGGFGGLGKALVTWLAEKGAQMLLVISPSDAKASEAEDVVAEVESLGCKVVEVTGEVEELQYMAKAVALANRPIKGVIHLAESIKVWARIPNLHSHADCYSERTISGPDF